MTSAGFVLALLLQLCGPPFICDKVAVYDSVILFQRRLPAVEKPFEACILVQESREWRCWKMEE